MNERDDENVFISELVDKALRFHEQLSDGLVAKFRYGLPTLCEISEGRGSITGFPNKGRCVRHRVSRNVGSRSLKIVPCRIGPDYFSSRRAIRFTISSCGMTLPC